MTCSVLRSTYADAIAHLNALIPELFTAPGQARRKFSLDEIAILTAALGNPQATFPSVLIAGTNGKGSTAATLASIARESGLRVGLYTSPHLDRVNERIRLLLPSLAANGPGNSATESLGHGEAGSPSGDISEEDFGRLYFHVQETADRLVREGALPGAPSFFEVLTALAFLYFAESKVDLAVLEVGMGGRLDATNIVDPLLSVITDISLDHQEWLGSTIDLIAREKAGILRQDGVLVTLPQHPEANQAIGEVATSLGARGVNAAEYMPQMGTNPNEPYKLEVLGSRIVVDSPLRGAHQHRNIALATAAAIDLSREQSLPITAAAIERGIRNTRWPGRLEQIVVAGVEFLLDVAHNPSGAWALRAALNGASGAAPQRRQVLIFACLRDKPLREMTQILFPIFDHVVLAPIHSPRATEMADLAAAAEQTGVQATASHTVAEAIRLAREEAQPGGRIVISGSVYLVGEARALLLAEQAAGLRTVLWHAPPFLAGTAFFGSMALLASLFDKDGRLQHRIARLWARTSVWFSGSEVQVVGLENVPSETAVFAANHTSYMDTPVVFASLPFQFRILAKKELWSLPFIGWYLKHSGQIPIDTANPRATMSSLGNGIRTLRDGLNVFVFPEGGRTPDGQLQPFLNGAAYLAIRGQVPLVPIALIGVYDLLPIHTRHFFHAGKPLKLVIGKPIPTTGRTIREAEALTEELRLGIADLIQQNS